jgi:hypothetical protein
MSAYEAQQMFDAAIQHINPSRDPQMWNMLNGLDLPPEN